MELKKIINFSPGPSRLPDPVVENICEMFLQRQKTGCSPIEKSHRGEEFLSIISDCKKLISKLLQLDQCAKPFHIIFLSGGASQDFLRCPINLLQKDEQAFYLDSGFWTKKAFSEGQLILKMQGLFDGQLKQISSSASADYAELPNFTQLPSEGKYLYLCTNNTIVGTQYHKMPESEIPLVADATSDLFAIERTPKELDKFSVLFCGTQKNLGTSGLSLVLVRDDIMQSLVKRQKINPIPSMLSYAVANEQNSLFNTPPVFPFYVLHQVLLWMEKKGGIQKLEQENRKKSEIIYKIIDECDLLQGHAKTRDRSIVNVVFRLSNRWGKQELWERALLKKFDDANFIGIKGHRLLGGFRASMYNAFPLSDAEKLADLLLEFIASIKKK